MNNNNFEKLPTESFDEYCHRISALKQEIPLTWQQIADIVNLYCGCNYSEWYYRNKEKRYLIDQEEQEIEDVESKDTSYENLLELSKLKVKLSDERTQINALVRKVSREETLKEIALEVANSISKDKLLRFNTNISNNVSNKEGLLLISDWHYGNEISNIYNVYNLEVAKKRVQQLYLTVVQKCKQNDINTLHIANLGDMIAGNIHLPLRINSRIDVITQTIEVSEILCEFLCELSKDFNLTYCSVNDNHSRIEPNKKESLELESLCRITDWYIKNRIPEITFFENKFGSTIANLTILGHNIACVHGDKDKPDSLIDKLSNFTSMRYDLLCTAHEHHFSANEKYGTLMVANGSLMGTDDYAFNLRLHSKPSQNLIIVSAENVLDTLYRIEL